MTNSFTLLRVACLTTWLIARTDRASAEKCGVYLAPSSIPGSGLGMFAGDRSYAVGDTVTLGDTVIPIIEFEWHNERAELDYRFLWDEYTWNGNVFPPAEEEGDELDLIMFASPGVGAAANSYLSLVNIEDSWIKIDRGVKADSPGIGASSPYYGREYQATKDIPAGAEIFVDYGTNYFESRSETYGYIPMPKSYKSADRLIGKFLLKRQQDKRRRRSRKLNQLWEDTYNLIVESAITWKSSRVLNALPSNYSHLPLIMKEGGTALQDFNRSIKELSWLEENGQCMDNIKVGQSENPDAGRGAFANRFIPAGGLVAPAPLIHIPDLKVLRMYNAINGMDGGKIIPDIHGPQTFQLIMNYCFGHQESTLLLCPYGLLTAFINHSAEKPNTRIQWSKDMRHPEWREQAIHIWGDEYHTGFQIDFVALRDIEENEEITIDYGEAWEKAWQEHVLNFAPRENYIPAYELNEVENITYRTIEDRPYELDGVTMWCRFYFIGKFTKHKEDEDIECRILKKLADDSYLVQLMHSTNDQREGTRSYETGEILWDVPSAAFYFADMPYERDHHKFTSFRHPMMIPDDIFPSVWKNGNEAMF